jgi:hypothetical protein
MLNTTSTFPRTAQVTLNEQVDGDTTTLLFTPSTMWVSTQWAFVG